jgi:hypothetical protein
LSFLTFFNVFSTFLISNIEFTVTNNPQIRHKTVQIHQFSFICFIFLSAYFSQFSLPILLTFLIIFLESSFTIFN